MAVTLYPASAAISPNELPPGPKSNASPGPFGICDATHDHSMSRSPVRSQPYLFLTVNLLMTADFTEDTIFTDKLSPHIKSQPKLELLF